MHGGIPRNEEKTEKKTLYFCIGPIIFLFGGPGGGFGGPGGGFGGPGGGFLSTGSSSGLPLLLPVLKPPPGPPKPPPGPPTKFLTCVLI